MSDYAKHLTADRRITVLRLLADSTGYQLNEYTLEAVLDDMGHSVSNAKIKTELAWLAEQDLITTKSVGGVTIATITRRGLDVAQGKATVPGVKKPMPE